TACAVCGGIADGERCAICADPARDRGVICVVEQQKDVLTVERSGAFTGLYHVLNGVISPLDGIGPEELNIKPLLERCKDVAVVEIVIATNPSVEGDATSLYLSKIIKPSGIKVTRIAHGIPVGADLEFADGATIYQSLKCRVEM
ncbi:MAG TPA: recombination mediator RecR, partial [Spirochaetota bacterium]|nr:recombination mediator RecR [Spirochaetota bacterium]